VSSFAPIPPLRIGVAVSTVWCRSKESKRRRKIKIRKRIKSKMKRKRRMKSRIARTAAVPAAS
jgi:hypothetical protein